MGRAKKHKKPKVVSPRKLEKRQRRLERKRLREEEEKFRQGQANDYDPLTYGNPDLVPPSKRRRIDYEEISVDDRGKKQKSNGSEHQVTVNGDEGDDFISFGVNADKGTGVGVEAGDDIEVDEVGNENRPFFGLLTDDEQSYFVSVGDKLKVDDFPTKEDRSFFINAVCEEAKGIELKLACSRHCSRAFQRVMLLMTADQIRSVFEAFLTNFIHLVQHCFGSHCCETIFLRAAGYMEQDSEKEVDDEEYNSMESLILKVAEELESDVEHLLTDKFATHAIRVLLLVLSEEPLDDPSFKVISAKKRREQVEASILDDSHTTNRRKVPETFTNALNRLITTATANLDTRSLQILATHPTGNPVIQLLLRIELADKSKGKDLDERSIFLRLLPDESLEPETESAKFIIGMLYEQAGSRLVEVLIENVPAKVFKKLYKNIFKSRMGQTARNEFASYVNIKVLQRLGKDDLLEARNQILLEVPKLVAQRRTAVIKTLIQRSIVRDLDLQPLVDALKITCNDDATAVLPSILHLDLPSEEPEPSGKRKHQVVHTMALKPDVHGSLLAQAMLQSPVTNTVIHDGLLAFKPDIRLRLAKNPISSRIIQMALTSPTSTIGQKKLLASSFLGQITELAMDQTGSYLADLLWEATNGQHFLKERFAEELASEGEKLRDNPYGRIVWRNWSMDTYQQRPAEWQGMAKDDAQRSRQDVANGKPAIQLARERHFKNSSKAPYQAARPFAAVQG